MQPLKKWLVTQSSQAEGHAWPGLGGGVDGTGEAPGSPEAEKVRENAVQSLSCSFSEGETGEAE